MSEYPYFPGHKTAQTETSRDAAVAVKGQSRTLRSRVLDVLRCSDRTADEVAEILGETVLSVRPRVAEMNCLGLIVPTPKRRKNASGKMAVVWTIYNKQAELI